MQKFFHILSFMLIATFLFVAGLLVIASVDIPGVSLDARTVLTGSMEPAIRTGSVVFIYPQQSYGEGDIVTFKRVRSSLETPITHRIIAVGTDAEGTTIFTTKGDANEYQDASALFMEEIQGKVIFHIPYVGMLLTVAKTPWGFAALIVIPAVLVISDEVKNILRYMRKRKEDVQEQSAESSKK